MEFVAVRGLDGSIRFAVVTNEREKMKEKPLMREELTFFGLS